RFHALTFPYTQEISLSREIDHDLGTPETGVTDGCLWLHYKFPDGFEYAMAMRIEGIDCAEPEVYPDRVAVKAQLHYGAGELLGYTVYVAVVTTKDSWSPLEAACNQVTEAAQQDYAQHHQAHTEWWHAFWQASGVELANTFLESVWYFSLYQFAASSRGETAPGLFGLWNGSKTPPWSGDYHGDINMVMTYWPIFAANHVELGEPYFKTFERLVPIAKEQTKQDYQIDGLKFPVATLDTGVELTPNFYRIMQCTTAFYGLVFWSWYTYTRDLDVLREHIFPILEEGAKFYLALTEETGDSLLIGPSWAPEQGPFPAYNTNNDLGLLKPFWEAYVEACRVLERTSNLLDDVKRCLAKFPEYPAEDGEFLDSLTAGGFINLNHPGHLAMVVPGDDVDADSDLAPVAKTTLHNYFERTNRRSFTDRTSSACDLTWPWLCRVALRLRDTDYAQHLLFDIGIAEFLKPNGFF
ncbi:MAG: hypothetical protein GY851_09680, partial [bacterium]|nr:hypothetical protein [bacterium]